MPRLTGCGEWSVRTARVLCVVAHLAGVAAFSVLTDGYGSIPCSTYRPTSIDIGLVYVVRAAVWGAGAIPWEISGFHGAAYQLLSDQSPVLANWANALSGFWLDYQLWMCSLSALGWLIRRKSLFSDSGELPP